MSRRVSFQPSPAGSQPQRAAGRRQHALVGLSAALAAAAAAAGLWAALWPFVDFSGRGGGVERQQGPSFSYSGALEEDAMM